MFSLACNTIWKLFSTLYHVFNSKQFKFVYGTILSSLQPCQKSKKDLNITCVYRKHQTELLKFKQV